MIRPLDFATIWSHSFAAGSSWRPTSVISGSGLLGDFSLISIRFLLPPNVGPFDDRITWIGRNKFSTPESGHAAQDVKGQ